MLMLSTAIALFAVVQILALAPAPRRHLERLFGRAFTTLHILATLLLGTLVLVAWSYAPAVRLYEPGPFGRIAAFMAIAAASLLAGISLFRGSLRLKLRFPLILALAFFSLGHILADGNLASLVLFGGMLALTTALLILGLLAGRRPEPEIRPGHDLLSLLSGLALFAAMAQLHPVITGVPVLTLSR
ncbi:MAG: NnrU family protein [Aestuariivirgaceae bacterium]